MHPRDRRTAQKSSQPATHVTLYRQPGERCVGMNPIMLGGAVAIVAISLGIKITTGASYGFGLLPAVGLFAMRAGWNRREKVYFFIHVDLRKTITWGYMNDDKKREGDFEIDEYTHWYTVRPAVIGKVNSYTLYVQINSLGRMLWLKEEIQSETPPEGWDFSEENIENKANVFLLPGLRTMITELDKHRTSETATA